MRPFFPPLLMALFAVWCGTLPWGGSGAAAAVSALALFLILLVDPPDGPGLRDPLRLGPVAGFLPWIAYGWCLLSASLSPVPRSGRVALILLPAFLLLPGAVARSLGGEDGRRRAARALAVPGGAIALWALLDAWLLGAPRPAMPLGHHNFLAAWLVLTLPLAMLPLREGGRWRWLGWIAAGLMVATLLATRSLAGLAALVAQGVVAAIWWRRGRKPVAGGSGARIALALGLLLLGAVLAGGRLARIAHGLDPSLRTREVYWRAGRDGTAARPLTGWGPGSTGWTLAAFLEPEPGVNPPGEVVGELHDLPLSLAYELGLPGLGVAIGLVALFLRARWRESRGNEKSGAAPSWGGRAGLLALLGGAVASLGCAALAITALPVAGAVAAGFALGRPGAPGPRTSRPSPRSRFAVWAYLAAALVLLFPLLRAQLLYDRARRAGEGGDLSAARRDLTRSVFLDPAFPLYRWRLAMLQGLEGGAERAEEARLAAWEGWGVAVFWETAGILGGGEDRGGSKRALIRAVELDPFSALAPFYLQGPEWEAEANAAWGARSLLAAPQLVDACLYHADPGRLRQIVAEVVAWPVGGGEREASLGTGWKEALAGEAERVLGAARARPAEIGRLALSIDTDPATSLSLHLFRRSPWPARWPAVPLCGSLLRSDLSSAWSFDAALRPDTSVSPGRHRAVRGQILLKP